MVRIVEFEDIPTSQIRNHKKFYFIGTSKTRTTGKCFINLRIRGHKHGSKYAVYKKPDCP